MRLARTSLVCLVVTATTANFFCRADERPGETYPVPDSSNVDCYYGRVFQPRAVCELPLFGPSLWIIVDPTFENYGRERFEESFEGDFRVPEEDRIAAVGQLIERQLSSSSCSRRSMATFSEAIYSKKIFQDHELLDFRMPKLPERHAVRNADRHPIFNSLYLLRIHIGYPHRYDFFMGTLWDREFSLSFGECAQNAVEGVVASDETRDFDIEQLKEAASHSWPTVTLANRSDQFRRWNDSLAFRDAQLWYEAEEFVEP